MLSSSRFVCQLSFGLMQLRFSGRLSETQAMRFSTSTATVSSSLRSDMAIARRFNFGGCNFTIFHSHIFAIAYIVMRQGMTDRKIIDPLIALPGYALRRAANAMMTELSSRLAPLDLRIVDVSTLLLVDSRGELTSSDIGRVLDIQRANMVPLLYRLEEAGLIERVPINLKSQAIRLTRVGKVKLKDVRLIIDRFERDLLARIPAEHRDHFLPALQALLG